MTQHIILIGFKHVGKSAIARALGEAMGLPSIDLDEIIKDMHAQMHNTVVFSCSQIVREHGATYFRNLERHALRHVLKEREATVVALGGGTPMDEENQKLLHSHQVIHITAPKGGIYERIMMSGRPAFFPKDEDPFSFFQKLWQEREPIYQELATITVHNTGSIAEVVATIQKQCHSLMQPSV